MYGWDTVTDEYYTAEPLETDAGDEKPINKAVMETKCIRKKKEKENQRISLKGKFCGQIVSLASRKAMLTGRQIQPLGVILQESRLRHGMQVRFVFVAFDQPGHYARHCRAPNERTVTFNRPQPIDHCPRTNIQ